MVARVVLSIGKSHQLAIVRWVATLAFGITGVLLAIHGQKLFLTQPPHEDQAIGYYVAGAIMFAVACAWQPGIPVERVRSVQLRIDGRLAWFLVWAAILNLGAVFLFRHNENSNTAWWLFLASLIVLVCGVAASQRVAVEGPARALKERLRALWETAIRWAYSWRGLEMALLAGIVGLAAALRLLRYASLPQGVWFDEAEYGLLARQILASDSFRPIYAPLGNLASPFLFFIAASFKLFGDGILSLRLVSILAGVATVPAFYFLARRFMQIPAALTATVLLAVSFWHVNFSRVGLQGILSPLVAIVAYLFLLRAWRGGKLLDFVLAGVAVSAGVWAYNASNLLPIVAVLFLMFAAVREWRLLRPRIPGIALFGFSALIAVSPLAFYALKHQDEYFARSRDTSIFLVSKDGGWQMKPESQWLPVLKTNVRKHLEMFNFRGDFNGRHNLPGHRMLDDITGVLAVLGFAYVLSRALRAEYFLLLAGFAVGLSGGIITLDWEAPQSLRAIMTLPIVILFAGIALNAAWQFLTNERRFRMLRASFGVGCLAMLAAWSGTMNYDVYFNQKAHDYGSWQAYSVVPTLVAQEVKRLGPEYRVLMSSTIVGQPSLEFVNPSMGDGTEDSLDLVRDVPVAADRATVIFLDPDYETYIPWLRTLYPQATLNEFTVPGGNGPPGLYELIIPQEVAASLTGIDAVYSNAGTSPQQVRESALDLDWTAGTPVPTPFDASWTGEIKLAEGKNVAITLEAPGEIQLSLDGELLAQGPGTVTGNLDLYKGQHRLEVTVHVERPGRVLLSIDGEPLPASAYFVPPDAGHGLLGTFYSGTSFGGDPQFEELDPFIGFRYHAELPFSGPLSVDWRGKIDIPSAGAYTFQAGAIGQVQVFIDGKVVASDGLPQESGNPPTDLTQGFHEIEVRFSSDLGGSRVQVLWLSPGAQGDPEIIPSRYFYPP